LCFSDAVSKRHVSVTGLRTDKWRMKGQAMGRLWISAVIVSIACIASRFPNLVEGADGIAGPDAATTRAARMGINVRDLGAKGDGCASPPIFVLPASARNLLVCLYLVAARKLTLQCEHDGGVQTERISVVLERLFPCGCLCVS